jgi:hypothetical protein
MKGRPAMTNEVIPHTAIDFVSYSSYDTTNQNTAGLAQALDYIESKLTSKPGLKGKRVWIGEYGFPAENHSPAEQDVKSKEVIAAAVRWGCPFVLYWELYNNEVTREGKQRGFWLIDDKGVKQPVYETHRKACQWGRSYVAELLQRSQRPPTTDEYRQALLRQMFGEKS